jgi:predicted RNA methylase
LAADPGDRVDMVLTNPPIGKKSSVTFVNEEGDAHLIWLTLSASWWSESWLKGESTQLSNGAFDNPPFGLPWISRG